MRIQILNNHTVPNEPGWINAPQYASHPKVVTRQGKPIPIDAIYQKDKQYKLLAIKERYFTVAERSGRVLLGLILAVLSLGLACLAKNVRQYFTKEKNSKQYIAPLVISNKITISSTAQTAISSEKLIAKSKIDIKLSIFCDIDCTDHNGAICDKLEEALKLGRPCITTLSILRASHVEDALSRVVHSMKIETALLNKHAEWDILQQFHPQLGHEIVILLPKSLLPDLSLKEKLAALDFMTDGTLKPISAMEALQGSSGKTSIEALQNLFCRDAKASKIFYIGGHGTSEVVAGLYAKNYLKFLDLVEEQNGKGLMILSCSAGGLSSLLNIPTDDKPHSFTTMVLSNGDYFVTSNADLLDAFVECLEDPHIPETFHTWKKHIEKGTAKHIENTSKKITLSYQNCCKVYFPHSAQVPAGFRPLDELGVSQVLTYSAMKAAEISHKNFISVDALAVEIQTPLTLPLIFNSFNSILTSLTPGPARHYLPMVQLNENAKMTSIMPYSAPSKYLKHSIKLFKDAEVKVNQPKSFFIKTLKTAGNVGALEDVVIKFYQNSGYAIWRDGDKYYYSEGTNQTFITPFLHALLASKILRNTTPNDKAVRSTTGGQGSDKELIKALKKNKFIGSEVYESLFGNNLANPICSVNYIELLREYALTSDELRTLLCVLLDLGEKDLAFQIYQENQEKMDPNLPPLGDGSPHLLNHAIYSNALPFVEVLLQHSGINLNVQSGYGLYTPLHLAIAMGLKDLIAKLVLQGADLSLKNVNGVTNFHLALQAKDFAAASLLLAHGASVNAIDNQGKSVLAQFLNQTKTVDFLLQHKADPNAGNPSAITKALLKNDINLIKKLMDHGAKPFEPNDQGKIPFVQSLIGASTTTIAYLLENYTGELPSRDATFQSSMLLAFYYQQPEIIAQLKERGLQFCGEPYNLKNICYRFREFNDFAGLKSLLSCSPPKFEIEIIRFFMSNKPLENTQWQQQLLSCITSEESALGMLKNLSCRTPAERISEMISHCLRFLQPTTIQNINQVIDKII